MELRDGRWYDDRNNSWSAEIETEKSAQRKSDTLTDCSGCSGCSGCLGCSGCSGCSGCRGCSDCRGCRDCSGCRGCSDCSDCSYCSDCSGCRGCSDCSGWQLSPQRITSGIIGSRQAQTTICFDLVRTEVVCGCFRGTLEEFESAVKETHGDNEHGTAYAAWIARVRQYIGVRP
jgi:hypothetical protein